MPHWQDPRNRGVYMHPAAMPPRPAHPYANDLSARLARVEEHLHFGAMDRSRIEEESRLRARDIVETMEAQSEEISDLRNHVNQRVEGLEGRIEVFEQERHTRQAIFALAGTLATTGKYLVRYVLVGLLALILVADPATLAKAKPLLLKLLGLGAG